jgi:hypothetical protein
MLKPAAALTAICLLLLLAACSGISDGERDEMIGAAMSRLKESGAEIHRMGGHTYVPIEVVMQALNVTAPLDFSWADEAAAGRELHLGPDAAVDIKRGEGGAFLMFDGEYYFEAESFGSVRGASIRDNRGNTYTRYLALFSRNGRTRLEIPLDERFNLFTFTAAIPEAYTNDRDALLLSVFGDGRALYTREVTFGHRTTHVEIDVTGVSRLWISYESVSPDTVYGIILGNPTFIITERGDDR